MTAVSILAPGTTKAETSEIVIPAGSVAMVGVYCDTPESVPVGVLFEITQDTPGAPNIVGSLHRAVRATALLGPGTFRVSRPTYKGAAFGVFADMG